MKKLTAFVFFFSVQFAAAQTDIANGPVTSTSDDNIYQLAGIEVKPEFPGGIQKFYAYFNANFKAPGGEEVKGKALALFIVEKDGSLSDIKVVRGLGEETTKEIIRVLKKSPKWLPGQHNGKTVRTSYTLSFALDADDKMPVEKK